MIGEYSEELDAKLGMHITWDGDYTYIATSPVGGPTFDMLDKLRQHFCTRNINVRTKLDTSGCYYDNDVGTVNWWIEIKDSVHKDIREMGYE